MDPNNPSSSNPLTPPATSPAPVPTPAPVSEPPTFDTTAPDPATGVNPPQPTWSLPTGGTASPAAGNGDLSTDPLITQSDSNASITATPTPAIESTPEPTPSSAWPPAAPTAEAPLPSPTAPPSPVAPAWPPAPPTGETPPPAAPTAWPPPATPTEQPPLTTPNDIPSAATPDTPPGESFGATASPAAEPAFNWSTSQPASQPASPAGEGSPIGSQPVISTDPLASIGIPQSSPEPDGIGGIGSAPAAETTAPVEGMGLPPMEPSEPAPTDLSQLSGLNTNESTVLPPPIPTPEGSLVTPPPLNATPTAEAHTHKFPLGLIIAGVVILLLVIAASAYFILGIGKPPASQPASLPAETTQLPLTNPPKPPTPSTPPSASNSATPLSSGGFGTTVTPTASASGKTAIQLLQERQRNASAGATTP